MASSPPPPEPNPDDVAEILLHLPPTDPAGLVRASAVCKPGLRTLTDPAFLRRYRAFHGTPHVLGFLHNLPDRSIEWFVPTTAFRTRIVLDCLDCRHGRALFYDYFSCEFVIWDPMTGHERRIPDEVPDVYTNVAVLCAAGVGCDHSTCGGGPSLLACAGVNRYYGAIYEAEAYLYSSKSGARSVSPTTLSLEHHRYKLEDRPAALVGRALYFFGDSGKLLRYDVLGGRGLSVTELPPANLLGSSTIVMTAANGGLGLATFNGRTLFLWSTDTGPNGDAEWAHVKLIQLEKLLPVDIGMSSAWLSGFAQDANVIFLSTNDNGIFTIELKSLLTRKVCEMGNVEHVFPFVSFYTPAAFDRGTLQSPVETQ